MNSSVRFFKQQGNIDRIPALLKQLGVSRSLVVAFFVTSLVLYLGPRFFPLYIEAVPRG